MGRSTIARALSATGGGTTACRGRTAKEIGGGGEGRTEKQGRAVYGEREFRTAEGGFRAWGKRLPYARGLAQRVSKEQRERRSKIEEFSISYRQCIRGGDLQEKKESD